MTRLRWAFGLVPFLFFAMAARPSPVTPALLTGTAWYPEQWPEQRWDKDLDLMQAAHLDVVRVGEFAWSRMEPREGVFDFGWLDRAIAAAAAHHIEVVIGTPTAAPPAWLTAQYPDVLRVDEDGTREEHGGREQFSFTSARYRQFAREIAERLAIRYGHNPDVIGWQIDNEINPPSFDATSKAQFQSWLQHKYGTIANLNRHWATEYWSQTYDNFGEIPMHSTGENPGLLLDFKHFVTDTWLSYIENQASVIRAHADPHQFLTTNTMHWNAGFDHYAVHRMLDMAAWDEYVPDGHYVWLDQAVQQDLVRGYKRKNFWVMETQPAFVNWWPVNRALDPYAMRELAWQAVGHGADAVLYWQWRSALNGQEQYHGTLLGPDGTPVPAYNEVQKIAAEFAKAAPVFAGTTPHSSVAMLQSYDSRWAIDWQRHQKDFDPVAEFDAFYRPLEIGAQAVDVIAPDAPLNAYKLVVAPALNVLPEDVAQRLIDYVNRGGNLVLGPRSGMKDEYNALWPQRQPGPLAPLLGGHVEQFYALEKPAVVSGALGTGQASIWAEALKADGPSTHVLMRYGKDNRWLSGEPAVLTRKVGKGSITYVGAWLDPALMTRLEDHLLIEAGVQPILRGVPKDVEVCERVGDGKRVLILINHGGTAAALHLPQAMHDVLGTGALISNDRLAPHDLAVLAAREK